MDDVISRRVAIEAIKEIRDKIWDVDIPSPTVPEYIEHHQQMIHLMNECDKKLHELYLLPSAQPERKKGKWIAKPDPYEFFDEIPVCSECGCTTKTRERTRYCPFCGADMRGEQDE